MSDQRMLQAIAVAGMALLFGAGTMSARQDPAAAMAPQRASQRAGDPTASARVIEVVAKRFTFEPSTIEVTEGERVRLSVKSGDGVHGLQIKKFKVNKLVPRGGQSVTIDFVASAPGTFEILCSEECGDGHESMMGTLVVKAKAKGR
jgi:cytochrome c oxidase subunit II